MTGLRCLRRVAMSERISKRMPGCGVESFGGAHYTATWRMALAAIDAILTRGNR